MGINGVAMKNNLNNIICCIILGLLIVIGIAGAIFKAAMALRLFNFLGR